MVRIKNIASTLKYALFVVVFFVIFSSFYAQPYNNSWINYSQQYYKFKISETSIYRIDSTTLANAGIPLSTINPANFQLFARGQEIPIYIDGGSDGVFNSSDFIEFFAKHNDGWLDEDLYGGAINHPNPYYSLFNDTINYYLTWNNQVANNRYVVESDVNFSLYTPELFINKQVVKNYNSGRLVGAEGFKYYDGKPSNVGAQSMGYIPSEGWFDQPYGLGSGVVKGLPTDNVYNAGADAILKAAVIGESNYANVSPDQHLQITVGNAQKDSIFEGYKKTVIQMTVPLSELGNVNTNINFSSINDLGSSVATQALSYIDLKYPHTMNLGGVSVFDKFFVIKNTTQPKAYLNFNNFNGASGVVFYELTNNKRIEVVANGSNFECLIPNSAANEVECFITSVNEIKNINQLLPVSGTGFFEDYSTVSIDTAFVIITHPSLLNEANNYANYRTNGPGNNPENAIVFNINDLYDQFAYGIEKHPLSIRNFIDFIADTWASKPRYLFLIGKSIKAGESRKDSNNFHANLVPSFGVPASDNMLTAGLNGTGNEPFLATGRLSAKNQTEVSWYLEKIEDYENPAIPTSLTKDENKWMKRVLHFGGGSSASEQNSFVNYLNSYKSTIEDTLFGGNTISFFKSSTAPIQTILADTIKDYIGDGVAMMTFLGHASASGGFDQNIDDVSLWPNQNGKYPFLLGLGCLAGDIHRATPNSNSEQYIIQENRGVIGYLSSVSLETAPHLNSYASEFYKNISYKNYKGSVGDHIKNTIINGGITFGTAAAITLHGDPSLVINSFELPDFMISENTVTFSPSIVTSDLDSFEVNVLVTNLGKAINDTIILELVRNYPATSFSDTTYIKVFSGTNYQETITFKLPVDVVKGIGLNNFNITVDAVNFVQELYETNNYVSKTLNISSGDLIPVYPYEFMIVPDTFPSSTTLKASTAFPFEPSKNYVFEIDTTDYFNSPIKETTIINQSGGVLSWNPNIYLPTDSTVYFWRVSKDSVDLSGYSWRTRSFQRIEGKEGWQQDHFFQFENNEIQFVNYNRNIRQFNFVNDVKELKGSNHGKASLSELTQLAYFLGGSIKGSNAYNFPTAIHVAVIDSVTLEPWKSDDRNVGQANAPGANTGSAYENYFVFRHNAAQMAALESFIKDTVPSGSHILMWSCYIVNLSSFTTPIPPSLRTEFGNMGAVQMPNIPDLFPFIFYHQKGNNSSSLEVVGDSIAHKNLELSTTLTTSANYGNIFSQTLGPAASWDSLSWRMKPLELPTSKDSTVLNVYGVDAVGNVSLQPLINNLPTDSGDISITNQIDASVYPYLRLNARLSDDSLFSSPQLDRWQITYKGVPEAALDPNILYSFQNDTVEEGVDISLSIAVKNIGLYNMDSLLISFAILDKNNNIHFLPYSRQKPLLIDSVIIANITFSTIGFSGLNSLLVDVNPNNDQPEKYHFNNVAEIPFYVNSDKINPILDVTFDGIHILDGDIVSPKSTIVMELTDENQYLLLDDTSHYAIYITNPKGTEKRIYFYENGIEKMQFIPASLPKNNSKIILVGDFKEDGQYKLRVQASDRTQNNSGNLDYLIGFEVISKSTITNIVNYPNPFTTSTRFVFTLTGSEIPEVFKIQIMTITGKVVREIHKDELGPINIGRNISDFAWDGTDTYGDRLANGLYLYHVITQINSEKIEHRGTSADGYFKKGFGKMYLFK
ncbi:MAG: C25 family cysteine peptidase [Vicingaceae bacterium]